MGFDDEEVPDYGIQVADQADTDSVMKQWLDSDKSIEKFEYILRGYRKNFLTEEWELPKKSQEKYKWMNDFGVNKIVGSIISYLDTSLILTDLTDDHINDLAYAYRVKIVQLLAKEYNRFDLDLQSYGAMVVNNCSSIVFFALRRARKFQTAKALQPNTQLVEQRIERTEPKPEKRGFLSFLPMPGRR